MFKQQQQGGQFPTMNQPYLNNTIHLPDASRPTYTSPLDQIKQYTGKAEDVLGSLMDPIKPYIPIYFIMARPFAYTMRTDICLRWVDF